MWNLWQCDKIHYKSPGFLLSVSLSHWYALIHVHLEDRQWPISGSYSTQTLSHGIKSSQATRCVSCGQKCNISQNISASTQHSPNDGSRVCCEILKSSTWVTYRTLHWTPHHSHLTLPLIKPNICRLIQKLTQSGMPFIYLFMVALMTQSVAHTIYCQIVELLMNDKSETVMT